MKWIIKEFDKLVMDNQNPQQALVFPALPCKKCGRKSLHKASKCDKCGDIFLEGALGKNYYGDKCPKCGYSYTEELKK
jgi:predicted Zn-ribbon and HTH transcriptional regulator